MDFSIKELPKVNISESGLSVTFSIVEGHSLAQLDMTEMTVGIGQRHFYFNRLIVPPAIRRQGLATRLVTELLKYAVENKINIELDINSYNDGGLSKEQLHTFYSKFGFTKGTETELEFLWEANHKAS